MFTDNLGEVLVYFLGALLILFIFFLIIREVITWYYKINLMVKQQNEQTKLLSQILDQLKNKNSR